MSSLNGTSLAAPSAADGTARSPLALGALTHTALLLVCAGGFLFSFAILVEKGSTEGFLCLLATGALLAAALPLVSRRWAELHEPVWYVVMVVAVGVTAKALYLSLGPRERVDFLLAGTALEDLLFPALVIVLGLLCHSAGYILGGGFRWRTPRSLTSLLEPWSERRFIAVAGSLVVIGLLSFVIFASRIETAFDNLSDFSSKRFFILPGRHLGVHGYLRWGAGLIEIAFYLIFVRWVVRRQKLWSAAGLTMAALMMLALAFPIFVSSRQTIMYLIIRILVIWLCLRGEPRLRYALVMLAAGLVIIGSMLAFRRGLSEWEEVGDHLKVDEMLEVTVGGRHFLDLSKTARIIDVVPERLEYRYGATLVTWLLAPIPRSVWPDKPPIGVGLELGPLFGTVAASGVPPGIVAELYLNFGLPGVLVLMLVIGVLLRSVHSTLRPLFPAEAAVLLYAVLTTRLAIGLFSNSVSGAFVKLAQELIPLLLALYLMSRRRASEGLEGATGPGGGPPRPGES